jgi:tetratricopeptide (TPR) repeat protein
MQLSHHPIRILLLGLCLTASVAIAQGQPQSDEQREEVQQANLLQEGVTFIRLRKPQDAIAFFEKVIAYYESRYEGGPARIYCASNQAETIFYLAKHASQNSKTDAKVVRFWCNAQFLKGYALVELGRIEDAQAAIRAAIALSPANSQYLSELGSTYLRQKDWTKAMETYKSAEEFAEFSEPQVKHRHLAVALRGTGYALIELGRLDEAEAKYKQSIQIDPDENLARNQLEYIRHLRGKQGL